MTRRLLAKTNLIVFCLLVSACANTVRLAQLSKTGQDVGRRLQNAEISAHKANLVTDEVHEKAQHFFQVFGEQTLNINNAIRAGSRKDIQAAGNIIIDAIDQVATDLGAASSQFAIWIVIIRSTFSTILALV